MPISRGRKPKRKNKKSIHRERVPVSMAVEPPRPGWFDEAVGAVIARRDELLSASSARELEQATAELVGAELHRVLRAESIDLHFDWWLTDLMESMAELAAPVEPSDPEWESLQRLLTGLLAIGAARGFEEYALEQQQKLIGRCDPAWLPLTFHVTATGDVWRMNDAFGTRFGIIAGFEYPGGAEPHVYLFDVDACALPEIVGADVFDTVADAAAGWRDMVGAAASDSYPEAVSEREQLICLTECGSSLTGFESRNRMDNWFRARRRLAQLIAVWESGSGSWPSVSRISLTDVAPMIKSFLAWGRDRSVKNLASEAIIDFAWQWCEDALPETRGRVSPHRASYHRALISDWRDNSAKEQALELLPEWVRFVGQSSGLAGTLLDKAVSAARDPLPDGLGCPAL